MIRAARAISVNWFLVVPSTLLVRSDLRRFCVRWGVGFVLGVLFVMGVVVCICCDVLGLQFGLVPLFLVGAALVVLLIHLRGGLGRHL